MRNGLILLVLLTTAFTARAESVAVDTGTAATALPSVVNVAAGQESVFSYHNDRYASLEGSAFLKSADGQPARVWYWFDDHVEFPIDIPGGDDWFEYQVIYGSSAVGEHTVTFRPERAIVINRLDFYTTKTDVIPDSRELTCLPPVDRQNRIVVRDVGYVPESVGSAEVLVWKDDKTAAATITVDDNHAEEMDWWIEQAAKYNARITWFAIGVNIGTGHPVVGSWADFQKVLDAGHDVQSHSYTHLHDTNLTSVAEYTNNIALIEGHLPGHKVVAIAYPGGALKCKCTAREAMKYHIGARGANTFINEAGKINYQSAASSHGESPVLDPSNRYYLGNLVNKESPYPIYYRGWNCHHSHNLLAGEAIGNSYREGVLTLMSFYATNNVWMTGFSDVLKYGQERDTASIETKVNTNGRVVLDLKDHMDDSIFDYPLSLVLRVPDAWTVSARVVQGTATNVVSVRTSGDVRSIMFDAIPDRGEIEIVPTESEPTEPDVPVTPDDPVAPDVPVTPDNPEQDDDYVMIASADEFRAKITASADPAVRYRLGVDLGLSDWTTIDFPGFLDGNGHVITGLNKPLFGILSGTVERLVVDGLNGGAPTQIAGISGDFGLVAVTNAGGRIRNVVLRNFDLHENVMYKNLGFFSGVAADGAEFSGCRVESSCSFRNRASKLGGIAGLVVLTAGWTGPAGADLARFVACSNAADLISSLSGGANLGGILGDASVASATLLPNIAILNCVNTGSLYAENVEASGALGGIVGERHVNVSQVANGTLTIVDCRNGGNLGPQGKTGCYYGGALGHSFRLGGVYIRRFRNDGRIGSALSPKGDAYTSGYAGGIIGANGTGATSLSLSAANPIEVADSANYGEVIGAQYAGGFISTVTPSNADNTRCLFVNCANYGDVRTLLSGGVSAQGIAYLPVTITPGATRVYGCENCFFKRTAVFGEVTGTAMRSVGNVTAEDVGYDRRAAASALTAGAKALGGVRWGVGKVGGTWCPELVCFREIMSGFLMRLF